MTDSIAPPAFAPRVISLVRYLRERGHSCTIFSDREANTPTFSTECGRWYQTAYYHKGNKQLRYIADKLCGAREREFQKYIEKTINVADFDVIFCTSYYYFPLQTTYRLAKKYNKQYIIDLRDIAEQWGSHGQSSLAYKLFTAINIRQRNSALAHAKHVTTISPWHKRVLSRYNHSTHLIYNGYDATEFYPLDVKAEKFTLSYTGKIYDLDFRDPRLALTAVQQLIRTGEINHKDIEFRFYVDDDSIPSLKELVQLYDLTDICHIEGYIPKKKLLQLMHQSSIMLVLTCKSTPNGAHGIMGTKFYEALGVEKPVLCVRSDEECLAQVIKETNAGIAGTNVQEVQDFILEKYHEWQKNGFTHQKVRNKELFSRKTQSEQIAQLL